MLQFDVLLISLVADQMFMIFARLAAVLTVKELAQNAPAAFTPRQINLR